MADQQNYFLWKRFKDGDDGALSSIFKLYADELYTYGLRLGADVDVVKDCIQEIFIQLINKRKTIKISTNTHVYLFKSLRNKIYEETKTSNRKQNILEKFVEIEKNKSLDLEQLMIEKEEFNEIQKRLSYAINALTQHQKEVIFLKYTEGFNNDQIAELLDIDIASVRTLIYRSLKKIKKILGENLGIFLLLLNKTTSANNIKSYLH